jgi:predicted dehydrogenase
MRGGGLTEVVAIASRDRTRADAAADKLGIAKAYGSYEALLDDPDIDAVYNPLPNHLHVPWSIEAARRGKHVLCEKPIGLSSAEAQTLIDARDRHAVLIQEAFMVWTHPQWRRAVEICRSGRLGSLQGYIGVFTTLNVDPADICNVAEYGGGALMDIGCYLLVTSRMLFGEDPVRAAGAIVRDPRTGVDTLTSMTLDFPSGQAIGTCGIRTTRHQRVQMLGSAARLEVETPFSAPPDRPLRLLLDDGSNPFGAGREVIEIPPCNPYRVQGDAFARAVRSRAAAPYPLEMSVVNMRVIEAVVRSGASGRWENVGQVTAGDDR